FVLFFITSDINLVTIGGANIIYAVFNVLGSNFRHTHIWISYGPVLERILISPAQHQIHHSLEVEHHNKNYGEVFAIWDWMFGTLYVPQGRTELRFGLADRRGNLLAQPHPTLKDALVGPFRDSAKAFSRRFGGKRGGKPVTPR
ncbi:MAG TPA: sterol desaturase family protein, partial [Rhizobiaceae bacterium]|nr:sterol desaturase family protein [Rhizobiaceae bacterium]